MSCFKIGERTASTKRVIMISFQTKDNIELYHKYFKTKEFHNILHNVNKGSELTKVLDKLANETTHSIAWIYDIDQPYDEFKKANEHLFEPNWYRYWFFEDTEKGFIVQRINFPKIKNDKTVQESNISDYERRVLLGLPIPSIEHTEHKLISCLVPYLETDKAKRFFSYPIFRRAIQKMSIEQIHFLMNELNIKTADIKILYFNSEEEVKKELCDFSYGARGCFYWYKQKYYRKN